MPDVVPLGNASNARRVEDSERLRRYRPLASAPYQRLAFHAFGHRPSIGKSQYLWLVGKRSCIGLNTGMETNYRVRILNRLTARAIALQNLGRWNEADTLLSIAGRYEALWAMLDARA